MGKSLRRTRGAIRMGITWGATWALAGGVLGFLAGVTFSALLMLAERRRRFDEMSLARFAGWGAVGGLLLSAVFANAASLEWRDVLAVAPAFALASAVCASGSLALARRASSGALPEIRTDAAQGRSHSA